MPLSNILQALEAEVEHQVNEIEQTAQTEVERIRIQTQVEVEAARQKRLAAIQQPLQAEQARILNRAKLEALQIVLGTREDLITLVLEATARRLSALSNLEMYTQLLQQLLEEALATLEVTGHLRLSVQPQDVALMKQIAQELGLQAVVEGDMRNEDLWGVDLGGVVVATSDGNISLVNTLEARLQRVANLHRSKIAGLIFGPVIGDR